MKIGENEKALLEGNDFEPISYEWMFRIMKSNYQEPEGVPIVRIMGQLVSLMEWFTTNWNMWYGILNVSRIG